jgi:hypothetical protein
MEACLKLSKQST